MSLNLWLITALLTLVVTGGVVYHVYEKGVTAGKASAKGTQEKYTKKVQGNDVKIDKKTPFDADRIAQLNWMSGYTVRQ